MSKMYSCLLEIANGDFLPPI